LRHRRPGRAPALFVGGGVLNPPAKQTTRRPARRRWPWVVLAVLLLVLGGVAAAGAWVAGTAEGAAWALRTGVRMAGGSFAATNLRGSLARGLTVERLTVTLPTARIETQDLRVAVSWLAL